MPTLKIRHLLYALTALFAVQDLSGCAKNDAPALVASAKDYLAKADYNAAAIQLKSALQTTPEHAEARFLLAKSLLETGDAAAAEAEVRKALELNYPADEAYPLLARSLLGQGKYDKVVAEVGNRSFDSAQARADAGTSVALAYLALGDAKNARTSIDAAYTGLAIDTRGLMAKAQIAAVANDLPEASKLIDAALVLSPKNTEALLAKAQVEVAMGQRDQAIATLESAVDGDAKAFNARGVLVSLLVTSGHSEKAVAQVDAMKKLAPKHFATLYSDALVSFARGDAMHARDVLQQVLAINPDHIPSLYLSGLVNNQLGSHAVAEEALRKVVARAPNNDSASRALALTYLRMGRASQAIETLEPVLQRSPSDPLLLRTAGEAYIAGGDLPKAAQFFARASAIDKSDVSSKVRLAQVRYATGDTARALNDLESIAATDSKEYQADLALITAHLRQRQFDRALADVAALEKKQPTNPLTYNIKGVVYTTKRDFANARASFEKALQIQPNYFAAARNLGLLDVQQNKADDARKRYEEILAKDPKNEQVLLALAELLALTGRPPDEVKAAIDRAIAAAPAAVAPRMALISHYSKVRDTKGALAAAQSAQVAFPEDVQVIGALGVTQLAAAEKNQALDTFGRLVKLQPQNSSAMTYLAEAQVAVKDYNGAIATLRKLTTVHPDQPQAWIGIAKVYLLSGHPEDAITEARKVQKEHPDRALGFAIEGEILGAQKKWSEAAAAYREGLARQPLPILVIARYNALANAGKASEAAEVASKWIKEHPTDAALHMFLADQSQLRKDYQTAVPHYKAALENEPDNPRILNNLAYALTEMGDPKAAEIAERAYVQAPFNPNVIDTFGWALVQTTDVKRGTELLRAASSMAPANNEVRLHLAKALLKSGDKASARRELEILVKLDQASPIRADAEKLLGTP